MDALPYHQTYCFFSQNVNVVGPVCKPEPSSEDETHAGDVVYVVNQLDTPVLVFASECDVSIFFGYDFGENGIVFYTLG